MTRQGVAHLESRGRPDSSLLAVGLSHADAHVAVRESVYANYVARPELRQLLAAAGEVVVLSTCNRTELYIATTDHQSAKAAATAALLARVGDGREQADAARAALVTRRGFDVARHLFRVAAGLESVVPGETEILGQVREAWLESQEASTAGPLLNALFQRALGSGRRVRAETPLARRPASVASAAVELADRASGGLAGRHVVVLGAGAVARALCSSLLRRQVGVVTIVARNAERVAAESAGLDAVVAPLGELDHLLESADVVVAATSAPHSLIAAEMLRRARVHRRLLIVIDLGVPRNVDPAVAHLDFCRLYDVDDLRLVVDATVAARNEAIAPAEVILERDLGRFRDWLVARGLKQEIARIRLRAEALRATELSQLLEAAGAVDRSTSAKLERLAARKAGRFLHEQIRLLKAAPA
jgi:glutamyl-tRNA reductase